MPDVAIRDATPADAEAIADLLNAHSIALFGESDLTPASVEGWFTLPEVVWFGLAERDGEVVGYVDVQHTRFARERLGQGALLAPEVAVVVEPDPETARAIAREYAKAYLSLTNYTSNLRRFGYTQQDIEDGGSDRLIDALIPHGDAQRVADAIRAHLDAGADHVCIQPLGHGSHPADDYRALAEALL